MGKESEVLQAAQSGNLSKLESLLSPKTSKVPFSALSLRRGPNVNWRDESGYTALHLASLNGHKDVVQYLLRSDASANIPDNAGSFALHLAAFNGHHEIARVLIHHGPSRASVNEPNMAGDTALHVAAQYGHRYVLQVLVESHADLSVKNNKEESALDLAAQYGKLATVQLFLFCDKHLISDTSRKHTALHLAARNGHQKVVELLLDNGMDINVKCDMGSALHCASLFGKVQVAKFLLERGIDISIANSEDETVLDVLCKHPSQRSQEITALIYEQSELIAKANEKRAARSSIGMSHINYEVLHGDNKRSSTSSAKATQREVPAGYDFVPPPRSKSGPQIGAKCQDPSYSVLQVPARSSPRLSDSSDFRLASVTPPPDSEKNFDYYTAFKPQKRSDVPTTMNQFGHDDDVIVPTTGYCVVGGIGRGAPTANNLDNNPAVSSYSHKQRKSANNHDTSNEGSDVYCELSPPSRSNSGVSEIYQVPPNFLTRSHSDTQHAMDNDDEFPEAMYSLVPPPRASSNNFSSSDNPILPQSPPPPSPSEALQAISQTLEYPSSSPSEKENTADINQVYEPVWYDNSQQRLQSENDRQNVDQSYETAWIDVRPSSNSAFPCNAGTSSAQPQSVDVDSGMGHPQRISYSIDEVYDNVNLKNSPKISRQTNSGLEKAESVLFDKEDGTLNKNQRESVQEFYDNVQISNVPLHPLNTRDSEIYSLPPQELYDNVNISNEPSKPALIPGSQKQTTTNEDSCYQIPPNGVTIDKNANIETDKIGTLNDTENIKVYEPIKIQRVKQKRTTIRKTNNDTNYTDNTERNGLGNNEAAISDNDLQKGALSANTSQPLTRSSPSISKPPVAPKPSLKSLPNLSGGTKYADITTTGIDLNEASSKKKQPRTLSLSKKVEYTKIEQPIYESKTLPRNLPSQNRNVSEGYRMSQLAPQQSLNEQYEWFKIDSFLTSLEEFATSPGVEEAKEIGAINTENVSLWLESLGMMQYEPALLAHGFDDIEFLGGTLEDADLVELGILYSNDRKKLIDASNDLTPAKVIGDPDFPIPESVEDWLKMIKLQDYAKRFRYNGYDNMDRIRVIWEIELVTVLEISTLGHRKRMMNSLGRRPVQIINAVPWNKKFAAAEKPSGTNIPTFVDDAMDIAKDLLVQAENLKLERAQYRQEGVDKTDASQVPSLYDVVTPNMKGGPRQAIPSTNARSSPEPRSASNRLSHANPGATNTGGPDGLYEETFADWKHHPDTLLFSSVTYATQYLGSHPVHTVKGVASTLEACAKMRAISKNVRKMPIIELSISVRGIDYIDANSKIVISSYEIQNISFCAQDPRDVEVLAYITRDVQTGRNYCHVFKAFSVDLADEIITTIGQSFHLAYEQHLKLASLQNKAPQKDPLTPNWATPKDLRRPPPIPIPYEESMRKTHLIEEKPS